MLLTISSMIIFQCLNSLSTIAIFLFIHHIWLIFCHFTWFFIKLQKRIPSYLFMAGMERCLRFMEESKGTEEGMTGGRSMMDQFYHRLVKLRKELGAMKHLRLLEEDQKGKNGVYDLDISKVIISTRGTGINGEELGEWLRREYHLEMEMCAAEYDSDHDGDG